jgi:hypothetical protein
MNNELLEGYPDKKKGRSRFEEHGACQRDGMPLIR